MDYFPDLVGSECRLKYLNYDIVALLDLKLIQHEAIATRNESFIGRIIYRIIRDMIYLKKHKKFAAM